MEKLYVVNLPYLYQATSTFKAITELFRTLSSCCFSNQQQERRLNMALYAKITQNKYEQVIKSNKSRGKYD